MFELKNRLVIFSEDKIQIIKHENIIGMKSDGNYTKVFVDDQNYLVSKTMKEVSKGLPESFIKTSAGSIVNMNKVNECCLSSSVVCCGDLQFTISRRMRAVIKNILYGRKK